MINSILDRYSEPVYFNNIKTQDRIITKPTKIKSAIRQHFHKQTAHRNLNQTIFNSNWSKEYKPSQNIKPKWYDPILSEISIEEVIETLFQNPDTAFVHARSATRGCYTFAIERS